MGKPAGTPDPYRNKNRVLKRERYRLFDKLRAVGLIDPPTEEVRALIQAGINLRAAKGVFTDAYTPEELDLLQRARRAAYEHVELAAGRFIRVHRRGRKRALITIPEKLGIHECPQCGVFHRDSGTRIPDRRAMAQESALITCIVRRLRERRRLEQRREQKRRARARKKEIA